MDQQSRRVGFVGVGQMGRPMVERMVAAGHPVSAFVRRTEVAASLRAAGVATIDSLPDLAAASDMLIVCTFSDEQLRDVVYEGGLLAALGPGSVLVSHVTGNPATIEGIAADAPHGVHVLDAPVSGSSDQIRAGDLTVMVGGSDEGFDLVRPVLASYASPLLHVGSVGAAQRIKLVNNLLFSVHLHCAAEAVALGERLGVEPAKLTAAIGQSSGASWALAVLGARPAGDALAGARPYLAKDVAAVKATAESLGVDLGELGPMADWVAVDPSSA